MSYTRPSPYERTLTSEVSVFGSGAAAAQNMTAPGSAIEVPAMGEQTTAFRLVEADPVGTGDVLYTVKVRRGAIITTVQDQGASTSLTSPAEAISLARQATAKLPR